MAAAVAGPPPRQTQDHLQRRVVKKIQLLSDLCGSSHAIPDWVRLQLTSLRVRFALKTTLLFYGRLDSRDAFARVIASSDLVAQLDSIAENVRKVWGADAAMPDAVAHAFHQYDSFALATGVGDARCDSTYCPTCFVEMVVDADRSELSCPGCGAVQELPGIIFDEIQFFNQEGQRTRSGTFTPSRHYTQWMMHTLAREPPDEIGDKNDPDNIYGEKVLARLREEIARSGRVLLRLTVYDLRALLQRIGKSILNKNVALLMKKLMGIGPYQPSQEFLSRVAKIFSQVIDVAPRVRRPSRVNRNYYPYYIYKIIWAITGADSPERQILYYIYLQGDETLASDDEDWKHICEQIPELVYVPTDRKAALRYRPVV